MPGDAYADVAKGQALRPLLPRPRDDDDDADADRTTALAPRVLAACESCRRLKVKCDGARPSCRRCWGRRRECLYDTAPAERRSAALKRKVGDLETQRDAYKDLFDALASKPEPEAAEILRRVRAGAAIDSVLRHVEAGDLLLQLHLAPDARMQYTFPYLKDMPAFLLRDNPYADSLILKSVSLTLTGGPGPPAPPAPPIQSASDPYLRPYHAAEVVDPRFGFARAAPWTAIIDDDRLFVTLLKAYFQFTHPYWPLFHKDCFLDDLVSTRTVFCSPLLVNAVLAAACHGASLIANRADFWDPESLASRLLSESRRLFELEVGLPATLTRVQAAAVLSLANDANGCDEVGNMYLEQAVRGAIDLDLFSPPAADLDRRSAVSHGFTAWALFGMQAVHRYHVFRPPLIDSPPQIPLPDPETADRWYGEIWLRYPGGRLLFPLDFGYSFEALCKFRTILNDIAAYFFGSTTAPQLQDLSFYQALRFRSRLFQWYEKLPVQLSPANVKLPHQLKMHMHYYSVVILMFQAVVARQDSTGSSTRQSSTTRAPLPFAVPRDLNPKYILSDAKNRLELLLRLYFLRHGFESFDIFMIHLLSQTGFVHLKELSTDRMPGDIEQARRSMIVLAAKGLHDQAANCFLGEVVLGMFKDTMGAETLRMLHGLLPNSAREDSEVRKDLIAVHLHSAWPVGVVAIDEDFERLRLNNRVKKNQKLQATGSGSAVSENLAASSREGRRRSND
ncbi:hypothetical protein Micbo1qcDRAFT_231332 [Microdochium bolleyi]|uniref:Zn(2)-C6 fungal-type domain-containing protein n=1 Tax=Microdochium bolleyi TaxID=196109 RepID=A0A136J911_9PEZI|nr:hypothetical protein Micbo1qcDRAFT_231332 [Microdochium bolleyi]